MGVSVQEQTSVARMLTFLGFMSLDLTLDGSGYGDGYGSGSGDGSG